MKKFRFGPDLLLVLLFALVSFVLGWKSLIDPDLGWHLVGGLYALENLDVPRIDPIGSLHNHWLAYSWLFEVAIAVVFKSGGFDALQMAQATIIVVSAALLFYYVTTSCFILAVKKSRHPRDKIVEAIVYSISLVLVAPLWHLRPQLVSALIFMLFLVLRDTDRLKLGFTIPLTILWANLHVYWIFAPVIALSSWGMPKQKHEVDGLQCPNLFNQALKDVFIHAAVLLLCGIVSPYGFGNIAGVWEYVTAHSEANRLIREFQPIGFSLGYASVLFWVIIVAQIVAIRTLAINFTIGRLAFLLLLGVGASMRLKLLPLFAIASVPSLYLIGMTLCKSEVKKPQAKQNTSLATVLIVAGAFVVALWACFEPAPAISKETQELFSAVDSLVSIREREGRHDEATVLNHFDDGGWLALGLWLVRSPGQRESLLKVAIDGRTLVMGQQRISEFQLWRSGEEERCSIVQKWLGRYAMFRKNNPIGARDGEGYRCIGIAREITSNETWVALELTE